MDGNFVNRAFPTVKLPYWDERPRRQGRRSALKGSHIAPKSSVLIRTQHGAAEPVENCEAAEELAEPRPRHIVICDDMKTVGHPLSQKLLACRYLHFCC